MRFCQQKKAERNPFGRNVTFDCEVANTGVKEKKQICAFNQQVCFIQTLSHLAGRSKGELLARPKGSSGALEFLKVGNTWDVWVGEV